MNRLQLNLFGLGLHEHISLSKEFAEKPKNKQDAERRYSDTHQASRSHTSAGNSSTGSIGAGILAVRTDKSDKPAYDAGYDYNPNPHICIDV